MLLGEKLTMIQAAGGCIVLLAVFLTNLPGIRMSAQKFDS
jgi:drug/metabolite transporter (DMT)-like permease